VTSADELCQSIGADLPFLRQIMNRLAEEGIVRSKRAGKGEFQIAVSPGRLFLGQVVNAVGLNRNGFVKESRIAVGG